MIAYRDAADALSVELVDKSLTRQLIDISVVDVGFEIQLARFCQRRKLLRGFNHVGCHPWNCTEQRHEEFIGVRVPRVLRNAGVFRQHRKRFLLVSFHQAMASITAAVKRSRAGAFLDAYVLVAAQPWFEYVISRKSP